MIHIMWGEKRWLLRWLDGSVIDDPPPAAFPDAASFAPAWAEIEERRIAFAARLSDASLEAMLEIRGAEYRLADLIQHILNHSTYHRGQVVLLLRQLGHSVPATDYRVFLDTIRSPAS